MRFCWLVEWSNLPSNAKEISTPLTYQAKVNPVFEHKSHAHAPVFLSCFWDASVCGTGANFVTPSPCSLWTVHIQLIRQMCVNPKNCLFFEAKSRWLWLKSLHIWSFAKNWINRGRIVGFDPSSNISWIHSQTPHETVMKTQQFSSPGDDPSHWWSCQIVDAHLTWWVKMGAVVSHHSRIGWKKGRPHHSFWKSILNCRSSVSENSWHTWRSKRIPISIL